MPPKIALLLFVSGIAGLLWLDRDKERETSPGLWFALLWFLINGSRSISEWIQLGPPPTQSADPYMEGSPLDRNVYVALIVIGLIILIARQRKVVSLLISNLPILFFLAYGAISVVWSDYTEIGFKRWIKALGDLTMILVVMTDIDPQTAIKRVFARMGFLLLPLSVLFIRYFPDLGRSYNRWTWEPSYTGVTTNKNMLGMITLICGLAAVWRFFKLYREKSAPDRRRHLFAQAVLVLFAVYVLLVARSTTSTSCFLMGSALIYAAGMPAFAKRPGRLHICVVGLICLAAFPLFLGAGGGLLETMGKDPTLTGRTDIWKEILRVAPNPLLGTGWGTFWLGDRLTTIRRTFEGNLLMESHNGYIEVYVNLGWIGVILLLTIIASGYRSVFQALRDRVEDGSLRLALLVTAIIYNFTEAAFKELNPVWIFFLYAAMSHPKAVVTEPEIPKLPVARKKKLSESNAVPAH